MGRKTLTQHNTTWTCYSPVIDMRGHGDYLRPIDIIDSRIAYALKEPYTLVYHQSWYPLPSDLLGWPGIVMSGKITSMPLNVVYMGARHFVESHFIGTTFGSIRLLVDVTFRLVLHSVEKNIQVQHSVEVVTSIIL